MSEAKVLSVKKQRHTLSNVKRKKKALVRNIYGLPRKDYWPVLSPEDENTVFNMLRKLLPGHGDTLNSNQSNLALDCTKEHLTQHHRNHRDQLVVGLRKIVVEIGSGNLKCLLLANHIDPPSLGYILGNAAAAHNIPFIAISNLKNTIEELLGFKSWCVGFKVSSEHFDPLFDKIKSILLNSQETHGQDEAPLTLGKKYQSNSGSVLGGESKKLTELYFYRSDKSKRMFVPELCSSQNDPEPLFLTFSKDSSDDRNEVSINFQHKQGIIHEVNVGSQQTKELPRYFEKFRLLPLQVKRFQENPNKQKWKKSKKRSTGNSQQTN